MSTKLEYRARERQEKKRNQAVGQRSSKRKRSTETLRARDKKTTNNEDENFLAAVRK